MPRSSVVDALCSSITLHVGYAKFRGAQVLRAGFRRALCGREAPYRMVKSAINWISVKAPAERGHRALVDDIALDAPSSHSIAASVRPIGSDIPPSSRPSPIHIGFRLPTLSSTHSTALDLARSSHLGDLPALYHSSPSPPHPPGSLQTLGRYQTSSAQFPTSPWLP